jgi:hypothetical protein
VVGARFEVQLTQTHTHIYTYTHTHTDAYRHTYTHTHTDAYRHTYTHTHKHIHTQGNMSMRVLKDMFDSVLELGPMSQVSASVAVHGQHTMCVCGGGGVRLCECVCCSWAP